MTRLRFANTLIIALVAAYSIAAEAVDFVAAKRIYDQHCASCHGIDGRSRFPDVPELRTQSVASLPGVEAVNRLKMGGPRKPPFIGRLSDKELMDALIYARTLR